MSKLCGTVSGVCPQASIAFAFADAGIPTVDKQSRCNWSRRVESDDDPRRPVRLFHMKKTEKMSSTETSERAIHPQSLAATNRTAFDLASNLRTVHEWFESMRAADRDEPPQPLSFWWDGYVRTDAWRIKTGDERQSPNRSAASGTPRRCDHAVSLKAMIRPATP